MSEILKQIDNSTPSNCYPKTFSNEIYYFSINRFDEMSYSSNLTIKYVHDGKERYKVGNKDYCLQNDQYVIFNAGNDITFCESKQFSEGLSIFMDASILSEVYLSQTNPDLLFEVDALVPLNLHEIPHYCHNGLGHYLERMFQLVRATDPARRRDPGNFVFYQLAEEIIKANSQVTRNIKKVGRLRENVRSEIYRRVSHAHEYLLNNFRQTISLDELSKQVGISKFYLIKCYSSVYGRSPYSHLLHLRLENAKAELTLPHDRISEISLNNGFSDPSSFSKCFKKKYGVSPQQFRSIHH